MQLKINLPSWIKNSLILLMVFQSFFIKIGLLLRPVFLILFFLLLALYFVLCQKSALKDVSACLKKKSTILLLMFVFWMALGGLLAFFKGHSSFLNYFYYTYISSLPLILCLYYAGYMISTHNSYKQIKVWYFLIILFTLLFGVFDFIIYFFDIEPLQKIYEILVNSRTLYKGDAAFAKAMVGALPRIQAGWVEPANLALFLCVNLPFVYNVCYSKYKLFRNRTLNTIIKRTTPILMMLILFGTMSPIYLIIGLIITGAHILFTNVKDKKWLIVIIAGILIFINIIIYCLLNIDFGDSFLSRITNTLKCLKSFNALVIIEPSLATRLICYINSYLVFLHYPLMGVGWRNLPIFLHKQYLSSPVPLTEEIQKHISQANDTAMNTSTFWNTLGETGIVGIILVYAFFFSIFNKARRIAQIARGDEKNVLLSFLWCITLIIILSVYESGIHLYYQWILFGIIAGYQINRKEAVCEK